MKLVTLEETKTTPLQEATIPVPQAVLDEMFKIMADNKGIGLAAPQVGYFQKFFIGDLGKGKFVCVNPKLYFLSNKVALFEEGCLSVPDQRRWISRYLSIRLRGFDQEGKPFDWFCKGKLAQMIQHEMDHLAGKCIIDEKEKDNSNA